MTTNTTKKAAGASNSNGLHTDTNGASFRTDGAINQAHGGKAITNQIARLALAGHVVIHGDCNDFTVCKYGLTRYCANFTELAAFAQKLGVRHE